MCSAEVKIQLFRTYCTSMYTSQLWWNYKKASMSKLIVAYNNAFRLLMGFPRDCSASGMFASFNLPSGQAILRHLIYKFIGRIDSCPNNLVANIIRSDHRWSSRMRAHWRSVLYV